MLTHNSLIACLSLPGYPVSAERFYRLQASANFRKDVLMV
jgi:hypothetical protein